MTEAEAAKLYCISPLKLRFFEQAGVVAASEVDGVRSYDAQTQLRLRLIGIALRLLIPRKRIVDFLGRDYASPTRGAGGPDRQAHPEESLIDQQIAALQSQQAEIGLVLEELRSLRK